MNVLDVLLVVAAVGFAVSGYRQGFVVGVLSVIGFLGGGLVAVQLLPFLLRHLSPGTVSSVVAVVVVIVCASVGQAITTHWGWKLRRVVDRGPVRVLDGAGGAVVNAGAMLLVAWLIGSALAGTSLPTVSREVRTSRVLAGVQRALPTDASELFGNFSSTLARNGFPQVFNPFQNEPITQVQAPDPTLVDSTAVTRARGSIVKVTGTAPGCGKIIEGSGFVYAPHRVMTNAHVVGGVSAPTVQIGGVGQRYRATVVLYDSKRDIAVLDVPDLTARALSFTSAVARTDDSAIVAGFPENGPFDVQPARVRGRIDAVGPDIYHDSTVTRDVYSLYADVRQGNSGGPLLTTGGKVYGVVFAKSLDSSDTGYALTSAEVAADASSGIGDSRPVSTGACAL